MGCADGIIEGWEVGNLTGINDGCVDGHRNGWRVGSEEGIESGW